MSEHAKKLVKKRKSRFFWVFLYNIKTSKTFPRLADNITEKLTFNCFKYQIDINSQKIVVSNKFSCGKRVSNTLLDSDVVKKNK